MAEATAFIAQEILGRDNGPYWKERKVKRRARGSVNIRHIVFLWMGWYLGMYPIYVGDVSKRLTCDACLI